MRLRILSVLSLVIIVLAMSICWSLLAAAGRSAAVDLQISRSAALSRIAQTAFESDQRADGILQLELDNYKWTFKEPVAIRWTGSGVTATSGDIDLSDPRVVSALNQSAIGIETNLPEQLSPFYNDTWYLTQSFGTSNQVLGSSIMRVNMDIAVVKLRVYWLVLLTVAALILALFLFAVARTTHWILRPVASLEVASEQFATSGVPVELGKTGPPEIRRLASSFSTMSRTIAANIAQQKRLIADAAHQLRTPLAALGLRIDLMREKGLQPDQEAELVEIERQTGRLSALIEDMLVLSRLESEHDVLAGQQPGGAAEKDGLAGATNKAVGPSGEGYESFALVDLLKQVVATTPEDFARRVEIEVPNAILTSSEREMVLMLAELLENARKYAGESSRVRISSNGCSGGFVEVAVTDDGPGLSEGHLSLALERFWRHPEHQRLAGSGLGLNIVAQRARRLGGSFELRANNPSGLAAILVLPC